MEINPPHVIPLVEVVPAPWTESSVVGRAIEILKEVGQKPVLLKKEVPGFVINRLQYAMLAECFRFAWACFY
jgi:L-gulonate 3-dehydrogenase